MRSSAPEGPIVPRAKQATPSGSSGTTACPAGGQPISQINRVPIATTKNTPSPQHKRNQVHSSPSSVKDSPRSLSSKGGQKQTSQAHHSSKNSSVIANSAQNKQVPSIHSKSSPPTSNSHQDENQSKSPPIQGAKHTVTPNAKSVSGKHPAGSSLPPNQANFGEYDDQEWDVGVGHLIIDLDADIAQADKGKMSNSSNSLNSAMEDKTSLKMKIKRTKPSTKTSEAKHVIVKSDSTPVGGNSLTQSVGSATTSQHNGSITRPTISDTGTPNRTPSTPRNIHKKDKRRLEVNGAVNSSDLTPCKVSAIANGPSSPLKDSRSTTSNGSVSKKEYPKVSGPPNSPQLVQVPTPQPAAAIQQNNSSSETKTNIADDDSVQGSAKKLKPSDDTTDACVGTNVGTITNPDFLGPCEPGTGVTLQGIVWHETEGGVLVVNVTWRGKSYVGTLLDCTKHDWAPPRLCDSPTSDLDSRTPKGRGKRGRSAAVIPTTTPTVIPEVNVAETRSGKLRNAAKGKRATPTPNPPLSPVKQEVVNGVKRKNCSKEEGSNKNAKRSRFSSARSTPTNNSESSSPGPEQQNSQSENDAEILQCNRALSPKLIECPEPNCGKKYTHINGLKYHQNHAHKESTSSEENEVKDRKRDKTPPPHISVIENPPDANTSNLIKSPISSILQSGAPSPEKKISNPNGNKNIIPNVDENSICVVTDFTANPNVSLINGADHVNIEVDNSKTNLISEPVSKPRLSSTSEMELSSLPSSPVPEASPSKSLYRHPPHHPENTSSAPESLNLSQQESTKDPPNLQHSDINNKFEKKCQSPVSVGSAPTSSLPICAVLPNENCILEPKLSQKEDVNGISSKNDDDSPQMEARSPAYSDISEANDTAPSIEDAKDFKDDKKMDPSLAGPSQYAYGLYYNSYSQPSHQYMMSMQQPSPPPMLKSAEGTELKDKERKEISQGNSEYMKIPPHYLYHYSQLYPSGYASPYVRENVYGEDEKPKVDIKECRVEEVEKGPTDLSRNSGSACSSRIGQYEKSAHFKDLKPDCSLIKDIDSKLPILDKRLSADINYRYGGPYDNRGSRLPSPHATGIPSVSSLPTPRVTETDSPSGLREDKCDKRPEVKQEGVKPTMETTGPPPPPTSTAYYPPFPYPHVAFDPYRPHMMSSLGLPSGFPSSYMSGHPSLGGIRYPMVPSGPEDLSRNTLPPGLYANSHKLSELQERAQKSPSSLASGLQSSMSKSSSPMGFASKEAQMHHLLSTSSPSLPISSNQCPITSIAPLHPSSIERKLPPHLNISEGYPYNMLPGVQFPPHFPPLGLNPSLAGLGIPPVMSTAPPK